MTVRAPELCYRLEDSVALRNIDPCEWRGIADLRKIRYDRRVMMQRMRTLSRVPGLAALLLAVLTVRALMPAGFMVGAEGIELCPDQGPMPSHHHDMHHRMHAANGGDGHLHHNGPAGSSGPGGCPFAGAAAAALVSQFGAVSVLASSVDLVVPALSERPVPRETIVPTRLPRGPPAFS